MIQLLEWLGAIGTYIGVGIGIARSLAKSIYRATMKRYRDKNSMQQKEAYSAILLTWVLFWPVKGFFYLLKYTLTLLVVMPISGAITWACGLVNAPVAAALSDANTAHEEANEWTKRAGARDSTDIDREFAAQMRNDAYERYERLCEDLGMQKDRRLAIASGASRDAVDRGLNAARTILKERGEGKTSDLHANPRERPAQSI